MDRRHPRPDPVMRGVGRASAAVTITNALLGGHGCAAAIDLGCRASVELWPTAPGEIRQLTVNSGSDTPLARHSLESGLRWFHYRGDHDARLSVVSGIPPAVGLKSSSAVSCAILQAVAAAFGIRPSPEAVARRSAELTRAIGLSATGAFDDALAAIGGGVVLTDNRSDALLARGKLESALSVMLWIPSSTHLPSTVLLPRFAGHEKDGARSFRHAQAGRLFEAMEANSRTVERLLGLRYGRCRSRLRAEGALAVGVSGMGPALAVLAVKGRESKLRAKLPDEPGRVLLARIRAEGGLVRAPGHGG